MGLETRIWLSNEEVDCDAELRLSPCCWLSWYSGELGQLLTHNGACCRISHKHWDWDWTTVTSYLQHLDDGVEGILVERISEDWLEFLRSVWGMGFYAGHTLYHLSVLAYILINVHVFFDWTDFPLLSATFIYYISLYLIRNLGIVWFKMGILNQNCFWKISRLKIFIETHVERFHREMWILSGFKTLRENVF